MYDFIEEEQISDVIFNIRDKFKKYVTENDIQSVVIGVSGGIDSALVCALVRPVCDEIGIKLIGRSLKISGNKPDEVKRAKAIGENFCHDFKEDKLFDEYSDMTLACGCFTRNEDKATFEQKIRQGNIKARLRMIYLYDLAQANKGLVLGTDNLTEELLGFWTLHGDVGDLSIIQKLWKTEVYMLAEYLVGKYYPTINMKVIEEAEALRNCIEAVPTDGLGITDSDFDQLGVESYQEIDKQLYRYLNVPEQMINEKLRLRYEKTHFKRNNPYVFQREEIVK